MRIITLIIILLSCDICLAETSTNCFTKTNEKDKTPSFAQLNQLDDAGTAIEVYEVTLFAIRLGKCD